MGFWDIFRRKTPDESNQNNENEKKDKIDPNNEIEQNNNAEAQNENIEIYYIDEKELQNQLQALQKQEISDTNKQDVFVDEAEYLYPTLDLLNNDFNKTDVTEIQTASEYKKNIINDIFRNFRIKAEITDIYCNTLITKFEIQPSGTSVAKIKKLSDDIALGCSVKNIRMEIPVPEKSVIGIEIPNMITYPLTIRRLIETKEFSDTNNRLSAVIGKNMSGNSVLIDLQKTPNLFVIGDVDTGKTTFLHSFIISLLYKATPEDLRIILINSKTNEFYDYRGIPHLLVDIVDNSAKALGVICWLINEIECRYQMFSLFDVKNIESYNLQCGNFSENKMYHIVVVIDEFTDLILRAPEEVNENIYQLLRKANNAGIHLIIATSRLSSSVISNEIKYSIRDYITFKFSQLKNEKIIDMTDCDKLTEKGDGIFHCTDIPYPVRVQTGFISEEEIKKVTNYIKIPLQGSIDKYKKTTETYKNICKNNNNTSSTKIDTLLEEAIELVIEEGQASTSMLQRRFHLGYARSERLIDEMERLGVIGSYQGAKPREILMTYEEWIKFKENL